VRSLSLHLRAHLKRLPDFDDLEAEKKALDYAQRTRNLLQALSFLISWPALDRAANHQSERPADFDRNGWPTSIGMPGRHHRNPQQQNAARRDAMPEDIHGTDLFEIMRTTRSMRRLKPDGEGCETILQIRHGDRCREADPRRNRSLRSCSSHGGGG
jgi:hypothetical protein